MIEFGPDEIAALLAAAIIKNDGELRFTKAEVEAVPETPKQLVVEFDDKTDELVVTVEDVDGQS